MDHLTEPNEPNPTDSSENLSPEPVRTPWALGHPLLTEYYDTEWGHVVRDDNGLFERLSLEAFQSGLSWLTILKRREGFRAAFSSFDIETVANYTERDVERLMADTGIIRNRMKINATISNAQAAHTLQETTTLSDLIWSFLPPSTPQPVTQQDVPTQSSESEALSKELKRRGFKFVGPTTMFALMEAIGMVDTHIMTSHRRGVSGVWPR